MKKTLIALTIALAATFLIHTPARAESAGGLKLAYVDLQRVLLESIRGQDAKRKIEKFFDEKQATLDIAQENLTKMEREYYETKPILTEDAVQRKQDEIRKKRVDLKRLFEDAERELEGYEARISQKMKEDVFRIIKELGGREDYSLIVNRTEGVIMYMSPKLDITKQIIDLFDGVKSAESE